MGKQRKMGTGTFSAWRKGCLSPIFRGPTPSLEGRAALSERHWDMTRFRGAKLGIVSPLFRREARIQIVSPLFPPVPSPPGLILTHT